MLSFALIFCFQRYPRFKGSPPSRKPARSSTSDAWSTYSHSASNTTNQVSYIRKQKQFFLTNQKLIDLLVRRVSAPDEINKLIQSNVLPFSQNRFNC